MKAHIGANGIGTRPICGARVFRTSGVVTGIREFRTDWSHAQCEKCAAKLAKWDALIAASIARNDAK